jgi:hypothetical protein
MAELSWTVVRSFIHLWFPFLEFEKLSAEKNTETSGQGLFLNYLEDILSGTR